MSDVSHPQLRNPPIVEAVFDVDCDLPPGFDLIALEAKLREQFQDRYPKFRTQFVQELQTGAAGGAWSGVKVFQFLHEDERQLVQVRPRGFSFNRLAPYTTLDDYLAEIGWTWRSYVDIVSPIQTRAIRLRYINRIRLPLTAGAVDLDEYLKTAQRLPDEDGMTLTGFLSQQAAIEIATGHQLNIVLTAERTA